MTTKIDDWYYDQSMIDYNLISDWLRVNRWDTRGGRRLGSKALYVANREWEERKCCKSRMGREKGGLSWGKREKVVFFFNFFMVNQWFITD